MIEIAFDALLRSLLKLFLMYFYCRYLAISWHLLVQLLTVLLHDGFYVFVGEVQVLGFVIVWFIQTVTGPRTCTSPSKT